MVDTRFSLMLIGLLLIGFVTCDRCTSNVAFKDDIKDFKVISVNTTTCYEVNSMKALDGCGVAKGRLTILSIEIQPVSYRKITDLKQDGTDSFVIFESMHFNTGFFCDGDHSLGLRISKSLRYLIAFTLG